MVVVVNDNDDNDSKILQAWMLQEFVWESNFWLVNGFDAINKMAE